MNACMCGRLDHGGCTYANVCLDVYYLYILRQHFTGEGASVLLNVCEGELFPFIYCYTVYITPLLLEYYYEKQKNTKNELNEVKSKASNI